MGSHAAQTCRDWTEVRNWHTISANAVSWANVTTLIVSPKLVRLLVIRGKYLITSGLPAPGLGIAQHVKTQAGNLHCQLLANAESLFILDEISRFSGLSR